MAILEKFYKKNVEITKSTIKESIYYKFIKCDSKRVKTLTVVFSNYTSRPPSFTFYDVFENMRTHTIFFNCKENDWYRNGVPGIEEDIEGVINEITQFKKLVGATRLVMTGNGMGAYGALLYGALTRANECLVFDVEPLLGVPGGLTERTRNNFQYVYPDLTSLVLPKITVFYGGMSVNNVMGAWLLKKINDANVICVDYAQHDTVAFFSQDKQLETLFSNLITGKAKDNFNYSEGPATNNKSVGFLWEVNRDVVDRNWEPLYERLNVSQVTDYETMYPIESLLYGLICYKSNDLKNALKFYIEVVRKVKKCWEPWLNLSITLFRLKSLDNALTAGICALKLAPSKSLVHFNLSKIYFKLGNIEKAYIHADWAYKINHLSSEYYSQLKQLASLLETEVIDKNKAIESKNLNMDLVHETFYDIVFFDQGEFNGILKGLETIHDE